MTVTDTLPGGVTFDSATPSQGSCSQAERHRHLRARHDRRRGNGDDPDPRAPVRAGHDHEPGKRRRPRSPTRAQREQLRHRPDDRHRRGRRLPAARKGASPLRASLVPAYNECTAPNRTARAAARLRVVQPTRAALGLPDGRQPGRQRQAAEHGRVPALGDDHGRSRRTADEADVDDHVLDHRRPRDKTTLADYTGELQGKGRPAHHRQAERRHRQRQRHGVRHALRVHGPVYRDRRHRGHRLDLLTHDDRRRAHARHGARDQARRSGSSARSRCSTVDPTATPKRPPTTPPSSARASSSPRRQARRFRRNPRNLA